MHLLTGPARLIRTSFMLTCRLVDGVSAEEVLLIVGYLNARVGSGRIGGDRWDGVRGRHGIGQMNLSGEGLWLGAR